MTPKENRLLSPGDLVVCRHDVVGKLVLWSAPFSDIDEDVGSAESDDVLLVIKSKSNVTKERNLVMEEWKAGSYMVLAPSGIIGWVGAGWVVPISNV